MEKLKRSLSENTFKSDVMNIFQHQNKLPRSTSSYINNTSKQDSTFMTYVRVKPSIMNANEMKNIQPHMREINQEKSISQIRRQQNSTKLAPIIPHVLDGYNACCFAYGMTGSDVNEDERVQTLESQHSPIGKRNYKISPSPSSCKGYKRSESSKIFNNIHITNVQKQKKEPRLVDDGKNGVQLLNVKKIQIKSSEELKHLLTLGNLKRKTSSTIGNQSSSRSHAVIQVYIQRKTSLHNTTTQETDCEDDNKRIHFSKLSLIDLAGSEKLGNLNDHKTKNQGKNINISIFHLQQCIKSLSSNNKFDEKQNQHLYRQSVITRLLQDSLGGKTKTVIIACVSNFPIHYDQTIKTLEFVERAKKIKVTKLNRNNSCKIGNNNQAKYKNKIQRLEKEIAQLKNFISLNSNNLKNNQSELFGNDVSTGGDNTCNNNYTCSNIFNASSSLIDQPTRVTIPENYYTKEYGDGEEQEEEVKQNKVKSIQQIQDQIERRVIQKLTLAFSQKYKVLQAQLRQEIMVQFDILKFQKLVPSNNQTIIEHSAQISALNQSDIRRLADISFNHREQQLQQLQQQQQVQLHVNDEKYQYQVIPPKPSSSVNNTQPNTQKNSLLKTGTFRLIEANLPSIQQTDDFKSTNSNIHPKNLIESFDKTCLEDILQKTSSTPKHKQYIMSNCATPTVTSGANEQTPNIVKNQQSFITPGLKFYGQPVAKAVPLLKCQNTSCLNRDPSQRILSEVQVSLPFSKENCLANNRFSFSQSNSKTCRFNNRYSNTKEKEEKQEKTVQLAPPSIEEKFKQNNKVVNQSSACIQKSIQYFITQPNLKPKHEEQEQQFFYYFEQMQEQKEILSFGDRCSYKNQNGNNNPLLTSQNSDTVDFLFLKGNKSPEIYTERNMLFKNNNNNRCTSSILKTSISSGSQMRPTFQKILPKVAESGNTDFKNITSGLSQKKQNTQPENVQQQQSSQQQISKFKKYSKYITTGNVDTVQSADQSIKVNIFQGVNKKRESNRLSDKTRCYLSIAQEHQNNKVLLEIPVNIERKTVFENRKPSFSPLVGSSQFNVDKQNQNFMQILHSRNSIACNNNTGNTYNSRKMNKGPRLFQSLRNRSQQNDVFFNSWRRSSKGQSVNRRGPSNTTCQSHNSSLMFKRRLEHQQRQQKQQLRGNGVLSSRGGKYNYL